MNRYRVAVLIAAMAAAGLLGAPLVAQEESQTARLERLVQSQMESMRHQVDALNRRLDDLMFFQRFSAVAEVDVVSYTGPPRRREPNPTAQGAGNPLRIPAYVFIPQRLDRTRTQPLIVLPHDGVHSNFNMAYAPVLEELIDQGYTIVAPDYRGSTGYGRGFYEAIDYGGLEIEDTYAARNFMLETYDFLDPERVGIVGWSHGGLHVLMNIFEHPDAYAVGYAGVPVSDLIARMGYKTQSYRDLFSADYHIGKDAFQDVEEYRRRSPSWNVHKYRGTPLLIHTTTNDEDVNVLEVERLIQAFQAAGKTGFEYKIYQSAPGGHSFNRLDTKLARESRAEIWRFIGQRLRPDRPVR
jgi:dipeptidyl aminopeptidase/acylaminoacyl peptidase